jgi:hypothetical protein
VHAGASDLQSCPNTVTSAKLAHCGAVVSRPVTVMRRKRMARALKAEGRIEGDLTIAAAEGDRFLQARATILRDPEGAAARVRRSATEREQQPEQTMPAHGQSSRESVEDESGAPSAAPFASEEFVKRRNPDAKPESSRSNASNQLRTVDALTPRAILISSTRAPVSRIRRATSRRNAREYCRLEAAGNRDASAAA